MGGLSHQRLLQQRPDHVSVTLTKDALQAVKRGHPWVWSKGVLSPPATNQIVNIVDDRNQLMGRGLYESNSPIAIRVYTRSSDEQLDAALITRRISAALAKRNAIANNHHTNAYRLLHGEADGLPGIVCDRYNQTLVLRFDGTAVTMLRDMVTATLTQLTSLTDIVERTEDRRSDRPINASDNLNPRAPIIILENGLQFEVDIVQGHKTGFYLDQRENRQRVRELSRGLSVLNLFCYTGGFSVAAAAGGATTTLSIDIATPAIEVTKRNLALNHITLHNHHTRQADVFDLLKSSTLPTPKGRDSKWDMIILDPPSMAPNRRVLPQALRAYESLNASALRALPDRGLLFTCSCSSHVTPDMFSQLIDHAAHRANVRLRILDKFGAGPDHPVVPEFPEGNYLKVILCEVRTDRTTRPRPSGKPVPPKSHARAARVSRDTRAASPGRSKNATAKR